MIALSLCNFLEKNMREIFEGFYDITLDEETEIFKSDKTIFVFDANCFLNLYRCEEKTKKDFMDVTNNIKEKLWFPFQVGLEYQRNRLTVISKSLKDLNEIKKSLSEITSGISVFCEGDKNIKNKYHELHKKLIELKEGVSDTVKVFIEENIEVRMERGDYISKSDDVRKWIDEISKGKISSSFTQAEINEINKEGEFRYRNKIGPGWKDEKEKGDSNSYFNNVIYKDKFGDLYLWKELLRKANEDSVDNIVFITNDLKEDWWYRVHGKTIGPLEVLKTEIVSNGIKKFKMYSQAEFVIKCSSIFKDINVNESSIKELEMLNKLKPKVSHDSLNVLDRLYKTTGLSHFYNNPTLKAALDLNKKYSAAIELSNKYNLKRNYFNGVATPSERIDWLQEINEINNELSELEEELLFLQDIIEYYEGSDLKENNNKNNQELELLMHRINELKEAKEYISNIIDDN
ncbi:PIN-like domain-containing protein [Morganella morganii]|uniref:PIN-like domain-containing protein n=1 Tax=Morganella morganii TaxID=582 RepID=UPI0011BF013D|nr:PIN-like domain-containing protein [Morganella morganii]